MSPGGLVAGVKCTHASLYAGAMAQFRRPSPQPPVPLSATGAPLGVHPELSGALVTPAAAEPEELSEADIQELEDFEVEDAPAGPVSIVPVAPAPRPVATHRDPAALVVVVVEDDASIRTMLVRALALT